MLTGVEDLSYVSVLHYVVLVGVVIDDCSHYVPDVQNAAIPPDA